MSKFAAFVAVAHGLSLVCADPVIVYNLPPVLSLSDAGRLHGQYAAQQISAFFATPEVEKLLNFTHLEDGRAALWRLRDASTTASPSLAEELAGIAEGAGVDLDDIWAVNLISELEFLERTHGDHCSDVLARDDASHEVWHGHTEDWSLDFRPLVYFVVYNAEPGADFRPVGGLVYPGQAPGFAVAFTPTVWSTSNSLFPAGINESGLPIVAVARWALEAEDAREVAQRFDRAGQAFGMNTQVVSHEAGHAFAAYVESAGAANQACTIEMGSNMTHFNAYKCLKVDAKVSASSEHRQAAADRFAAPRSPADVVAILGDTSDKDYPIYRANHTMVATLFHSSSGRFWAWHGSNPATNEPDWTSTLEEVFQPSFGSRWFTA